MKLTAIKRTFLIIGIFFSTFSFTEDYPFFMPPNDWLLTPPEYLAPRVKFAFLRKKNSGFCSSVNLATEEIRVSAKDYLQAVRKIHEEDPKTRWREVGKIQTRAGEAVLTEVDTKTEWGAVRLMQMIFIKEQMAYILTAAASKDEFAQYYNDFKSVFASFTLSSDLISALPSPSSQEEALEKTKVLLSAWKKNAFTFASNDEHFADVQFQRESWLPFQESIIKDFADMGAPWQILFLEYARSILEEPDAQMCRDAAPLWNATDIFCRLSSQFITKNTPCLISFSFPKKHRGMRFSHILEEVHPEKIIQEELDRIAAFSYK